MAFLIGGSGFGGELRQCLAFFFTSWVAASEGRLFSKVSVELRSAVFDLPDVGGSSSDPEQSQQGAGCSPVSE